CGPCSSAPSPGAKSHTRRGHVFRSWWSRPASSPSFGGLCSTVSRISTPPARCRRTSTSCWGSGAPDDLPGAHPPRLEHARCRRCHVDHFDTQSRKGGSRKGSDREQDTCEQT